MFLLHKPLALAFCLLLVTAQQRLELPLQAASESGLELIQGEPSQRIEPVIARHDDNAVLLRQASVPAEAVVDLQGVLQSADTHHD